MKYAIVTSTQLASTLNTRGVERRVLQAANKILGRGRYAADFEHGHWWVTDLKTGAQWDAVDAEGGRSVNGFDFEQVTEGDTD